MIIGHAGTRHAHDPIMATQNQRSTESYGLGQSGYTAGRRDADPALARTIEVRNRSYPARCDEHMLELGDDERWLGGGGSRWVPDAPVERGAHSALPSP